MCGSDLTKTKKVAVEKLKHALGENLFAVILSGNVSPKRYKKGWGTWIFCLWPRKCFRHRYFAFLV